MRKTIVVIIAVAVAAMVAGCTAKPGDAGRTSKKVADQRLAVYNSLRRLIYKDACGSEGPITICVDKIVVSDSTTLVETRIRNSSQYAFSFEDASGVSVLLINDENETLELVKEKSAESLEPGERDIQFRTNGHLNGEPVSLTLKNKRMVPAGGFPYQFDKELIVLVKLSEEPKISD